MSNPHYFRLLREGGWVVLGQVLSAVAAVISIRIMTELLSPEEFGRLTLLVGAAGLVLGLVSTPRLQAVIRYYPDEKKKERLWLLRRTAARLINILLIAAAVIITLGGGIISSSTNNRWYTGILIAALLFMDAIYEFEQVFLNAGRRQRCSAVMQAANAWSKPLAAICIVLLLDSSAESALFGYVIGSGLVLVVRKIVNRIEIDGNKRHSLTQKELEYQIQLSNVIKRYAFPLVPLAVFGWLSGMGDRYIIAEILPMSDVGLYAAIYGLSSRPFIMMSAIIEQTLRPVLYNAISENDAQKIESVKKRMVLITIGGVIVGVISFVLLKEIAAYLFLSAKFRSASVLMPWIALGYGFFCISTVFTRFCYAFDSTRYVLVLTVVGSLIGIVVLIPAAFFFGLSGAVFAVPVRFGIELALSILLSRKAEYAFLNVAAKG